MHEGGKKGGRDTKGKYAINSSYAQAQIKSY